MLPRPTLPLEHLAHLQRPVSIIVASRDDRLVPHLVRGLGCRVQQDPLRITVLLTAIGSEQVLDDLRRSDRIAVTFSQPSTHRTIQFKGCSVDIRPGERADRELAAAYAQQFCNEIVSMGYPYPVIAGLVAHDPFQLVAVSFSPEASFDQTPGAQPAGPVRAA
jgi:hypothetical protein